MATGNRMTKFAAMLIGAAGLMAIGGCADTSAAKPATPPMEVNFALDKCQQIDMNLYKCPAIDKPICTPEFQRTDVDCVRIGPKGSVFVQRGGVTIP
ncbi:MAG TPA: hypothetical protein VMU16_06625 [Candidatus Binataceae bacterium]|nr:hypothetical protein [Candidatus Binataceae bacterium]